MNFLGDFIEDFTALTCMFTTHQADGAPVAPLSAFEAADVLIYKNGNAAQKTTTNGVTMTSPFDSITGLHCVTIDTSNDTGDAGFWVAGAQYTLVLSPDTETVDGITVAKVIGSFTLSMGVNVTSIAANVITAASIAADAITDAKVAADVTIASVTGAVGSVTGAVGSVTGNVGGNVVGSVASVTAGVTLAASAVTAIWDKLTSALTTVGSIGKLLVDNIDAAVSSRLASASYTAPLSSAGTRSAIGLASANLDTQLTTIDDFLDTEVAAIKAKTDSLTFTVAGQVDANIQSVNDVLVTGNGQTGTEWGP